MTVNNFYQFDQDCWDAFKLDCNKEDLQDSAEARKCFKQLKKQSRRIKKIEKLQRKVLLSKSRFDYFLKLLYNKYIK